MCMPEISAFRRRNQACKVEANLVSPVSLRPASVWAYLKFWERVQSQIKYKKNNRTIKMSTLRIFNTQLKSTPTKVLCWNSTCSQHLMQKDQPAGRSWKPTVFSVLCWLLWEAKKTFSALFLLSKSFLLNNFTLGQSTVWFSSLIEATVVGKIIHKEYGRNVSNCSEED